MALGAARAGGVLKSTGVRRTTTINAAQKAKIDTEKTALINKPPSPPQNIADLAGGRLTATRKNQHTREGSEMAPSMQSDYEDNGEIEGAQHRANVLRMEIQEREQLANRLPREFTYHKPLGGLGFYFVLLFIFAKDVLAIILKIVELIADVTVILGIVVWVIATVVDFFAFITSQIYFFINGVSMSGKKAKIQAMGFIIEIIPILGFLPTETIAFIWVRIETNKEAKQKAIDEMNENIEELNQEIATLSEELQGLMV